MLNRIFKSFLIGVFALVIASIATSCQKEKYTIGVIIVKNSVGNTVSGATVTLHPKDDLTPQASNINPDLRKTEQTDANGRAEFTYELEAILNINVVAYEGNDTLEVENIIRLEQGKIITKVVEIN
jgi:hypothetical protein